MAASKKMQDRFVKIVQELACHEENRNCFDCNQRGPTYVNITIGSFVCTKCGGALRKYSHRVKSISMSNFSQNELDFLRRWGNKACRKTYFALYNNQTPVEPDMASGNLDDFLRQKYQLKRWYAEPTEEIKAEALRENQAIIDRLEKGGGHSSRFNQRQATGNTAAGLIVLPSKLYTADQPTTGSTVPTSTGRPASLTAVSTPRQQFSQLHTHGLSASAATSVSSAVARVPMPTTPPTKLPAARSDPFGDLVSDPFNPWASAPASTTATVLHDPFGAPPPSQTALKTTQQFSSPSYFGSAAPVHSLSSGALRVVGGGDKYAALAELDGIFKSACSTTTAVPSKFTQSSGALPLSNGSWYDGNTTTTGVTGGPFPASQASLSQTKYDWAMRTQQTYSTQFQPQIANPFSLSTTGMMAPSSHNPFAADTVTQNPSVPTGRTTSSSVNPFQSAASVVPFSSAQAHSSGSNPFTNPVSVQQPWTNAGSTGVYTSNPFLQTGSALNDPTTMSGASFNGLFTSGTNHTASLFR